MRVSRSLCSDGRFPVSVVLFLMGVCATATPDAFAQSLSDLGALEEKAVQAAVARVAPSVVRIETLGGVERIGRVMFGSGPATGLIVSEDGLVISSAFNFAKKPTSILVVMPDGTRTAAKLVATDHSRKLTLLKIKTETKLPVPEAVAKSEMRVGQWSIAVGRSYDGPNVNLSVGIVSALDRIWGKAVQTDAKISPSNYGGPLIDIRGRVLGVLVPLSPSATIDTAGAEWYDSGIGFAVPLAHIHDVLEKLKLGVDAYPGLMGVSFKSPDLYGKVPTIAAVRTKSPAAAAGLMVGDRILKIEGQKIEHFAQVKHRIQNLYAGDTVRLVVRRGKESLDRELVLAQKLVAYEHPFLGILPKRPLEKSNDESKGVVVRYVYPDSPAQRAGIKIGDTVDALDGNPTKGRHETIAQMAQWSPGDVVKLTYRRGDQSTETNVTLDTLPRSIPDELPLETTGNALAANHAGSGKQAIKIAEFKNQCFVYLPTTYASGAAHGVVVWPQRLAARQDEQSIALWREACERDHLMLLVPKSANRTTWERSETAFIRKTLDHLMQKKAIDPSRIIVYGQGVEAAVAYRAAFANRDRFRAVVAINGSLPLSIELPEVAPTSRLAIFTTFANTSKLKTSIQLGATRLEKKKYPVTLQEIALERRRLSRQEFSNLARWIDSLDRI